MADNFNQAIGQVYRHLADKEVTEAVMLGEEILSDVLSDWQRDRNDETACRYIAATCAYATALLPMQRQQEAYAACMTALAYTARMDVEPQGLLALLVIAWNIIEHTLSQTAPAQDTNAREYVAELTASFGSLLYKYYYETGRLDPDCPSLQDAYSSLSVIIGLVDIDRDVTSRINHISTILQNSERLGLIQ